MRVPIRWLKEFVEISVSTEELAHRLTMSGIEVAALERVPSHGLSWEGIYVGEVVEVRPHPNADRLAVAMVDYGQGPVKSVTGAPNVRKRGQKVPVAIPGARVVNAYGEDPSLMEVKSANIRGVDSQAVVCSERELGLSDDHTGVLLLDRDAPVGTPLGDLLAEEVLELDLTPNLGRCLSIIGVAREAAALTGGKLKVKAPQWKPFGESIKNQARVEIADPDLCARYIAVIIRDVQSKPAPFWMRYRLLLSGMRSIHALVDITNYVMLEWGQPLHAFDYEKLVGRAGGRAPTITVRRAKSGEKITTLDQIERTLTDDMLVIADERGAIAIAGVMGGLDTEVSETTKHVLLESASFHAINNRRTAQRLQLPSEASHRFSRGVPPELAERAAVRAAELMRRLTRGKIAPGLLDVYPGKREPKTILFVPRDVERLLGMNVKSAEIRALLKRLSFTVRMQKRAIAVTVPYDRLDVEIPADLVEEVARVIGYDRLPSTLLRDTLPPQRRDHALEIEERVRDILVGSGLTEVITYSLTSLESVSKLYPPGQFPHASSVELENPISRERTHMRQTFMDGLLETLAANQRHQGHIAIFEVGRVYLPDPTSVDGLPKEPRRLGIALAGLRRSPSWAEKTASVDFFDLKGIVETLLQHLGIEGAKFQPASISTFHLGRCAELQINDERLGVLGEVHPQVVERFDLKGRVYLAELDLERMLSLAGELRPYRPLPRFPGIRQDIAVVVDGRLASEQIERLIWESGGELLRSVNLFDVYYGEQVPPGKKSLAYALYYLAEDRTLTDPEAQAIHARIQETLERELGAQVRGVES
jgi:phenylalanyl-tRNA synthetase beta chain